MAADQQIPTLDDLCTALEQAMSAADVRLIASAWDRRPSRVHQSWGSELIFDAHRAFDGRRNIFGQDQGV